MKKFILLLLLLGIQPGLVFALGLGNLDVDSALNEPFSARIALLSADKEELDNITVGLADSEAFSRAGIERLFLLSQLKFVLQRSEDGSNYIRVHTQEPILEPFLNFLVEVNWSRGRLLREYTVLLDPPLYDPNVPAKQSISVAPIPADIEELTGTESIEELTGPQSSELEPRREVARRFQDVDSQPGTLPSVAYSGDDYGPTQSSDTLWSIASATRPNNDISINRMMLALLRVNPDAFLDRNINGLKRGMILEMPDESELNRLSNAEVLAEVKSQHALWSDIRGMVAEKVPERPVISPGSQPSAGDAEEVEKTVTEIAGTEAELKLVAASANGEGSAQVAREDSVSGVSESLTLAKESIQALTQENVELQDRLQESEILIEDLKRLISLKDDELALLQSQSAQREAMEEGGATVEEAVEAAGVEAEATADMEEEAVDEETAEMAEEEAADEEIAEAAEVGAEETAGVAEGESVPAETVEEPESTQTGIIGTVVEVVNTYVAPVKEIVMGNLKIVMAIGGVLLLAIAIRAVIMKFRASRARVVEIAPDAVSGFAAIGGDTSAGSGIDVEYASSGGTDISDVGEVDSEAITNVPDVRGAEPDSEASTNVLDVRGAEPDSLESDDEEDPLQEVNTYLAFEQYDQAEKFVRDVIAQNPNNPEFHIKLLEVFYTSGNKQAYEESARILRDLVHGEGEHWDMATAMWSEISPNRGLFDENTDEQDSPVEDITGGDIVNIANEEEIPEAGIVNIANDEEIPEAGIVNIATDSEIKNDGLDFDMGISEEKSVSQTANEPSIDEDVLDMNTGATDRDELEGALDIADLSVEEDGLSLAEGYDQNVEEGLIDMNEIAGGTDEELLEVETEPAGEIVDETVEFNLATNAEDVDETDDQDNVIDFDLASVKSSKLESDVGDAAIAFDMPSDEDSEASFDELEDNTSDDGDIGLDTSGADDKENEIDFDFNLDEEESDDTESSSIDFESTVRMPKLEAVDGEDDEDYGVDTTVFVPRSSPPEEQSAEDEIATKLDLAKAYVELDNKDSAKKILNEVITEGNDEQKKQAEELLSQV